MYLLDSNACIDFALGRSDALRQRIRAHRSRGLGASAVTLAELRVGARRPEADPRDEKRLDVLMSVLTVYPFDEAAADVYGAIARELGVIRNSFDRLIAAHALSLRHVLVTNNVKHFSNVPGLVIENWTL